MGDKVQARSRANAADSQPHIERVVTALVHARRMIQLYPRTNPLVRASLDKLSEMLAPGSQSSNAHDLQVCEVRADGFYLGKQRLCPFRTDVERFALLLYREGAKIFRYEPGARLEDALAFLEAVQEAEAGKSSGNVRLRMSQPRLGVEIFSAAITTSGDSGAAPLPLEVLGYLVAERQRRQAEGIPGSHLRDVLAFLMAAEQGREKEQALLLNTLSDAEKLAQTLSYVTHGAEGPESEADSGAAHALQQTLRHLEVCINEFPQDMRHDFLTNLSEAVLGTDTQTRDCILNAVLPGNLAEGQLEMDLLTYLPPRLSADVLLRHIQLHDGTINSLQSFVRMQTPKAGARVLELFSDALDSLPPSPQTNEVKESLRTLLPQKRAAAQQPPAAPPPESLAIRAKAAEGRLQEILAMPRAEAEALRADAATAIHRLDDQQDTLTFFYLFVLGAVGAEPHMLEWLQRTLLRAVEDRDFEFVNHVIQLALGKVRPDVREDAFPTLQSYLRTLYGADGMSAFLNHLAAQAKQETGTHNVHDTLDAIASDATPALFLRLETEEAKQRRFDLLRLLLDLGPTTLQFLREQVRQPHWYVVRNAVYLLGRLPHLQNIEALEHALAHKDPRVRVEALRALANTPAASRVELLLHSLQDPEPAVRGLAAEILARTGDRSVAPLIAARLRSTWRVRRNPEYALSLLQALGEIGGAESIVPLRRFLWSTLLPGTRSRRQLRTSTRWALTQVWLRAQSEDSKTSAVVTQGLEEDPPRARG